ncbi:MAG: trypsin-like peptidase domain-containing protein, partial [Gemmatimonadales bacterium]
MIRRSPVALLTVLLTALWLCVDPATAQSAAPRPSDSESLLRALEDAFVSVADRATPSVVNVSVKPKRTAAPEAGESPEADPRFREFFGPDLFERFFRRRPPREEGRSSGSGVIVDPQGYILTNNHVVENAGEVEVRLSDDRKFKAAIVGRDAKTDLAVLKVDAAGVSLPVAALGDSDRIRIGQWAIAIGNPFPQYGLDRSLTVGVVSAVGRKGLNFGGDQTPYIQNYIQTDAAINPGNSGGPLVNIEGRVIGINAAITSPNPGGGNVGIGFAIPVNLVRQIMPQLTSTGT